MHNSESVLEKKTHKLLLYFEMQTDHLISAGQELVIVNKKYLLNIRLCHPSKTLSKIKRKRKER